MTIPANAKPPAHYRLTFDGIFGTVLAPVEEWSFRLNFTNDAPGTDQLVPVVTAAAAAYATHVGPRTRAIARLQQVKLASIQADGFYNGQATVLGVDTPGTGVSDAMPLSTSVAVSLLTATRGPRGRGRFFLPAPAMGVLAADGTMTATTAQNIATSMAAFLNALNGITGLGSVVVASSSGFLRTVTGIKVGRVPDVIRSRREKQMESYGANLGVTASAG